MTSFRLTLLALLFGFLSGCIPPSYMTSPRFAYYTTAAPCSLEFKGAIIDKRDQIWGVGFSEYYGFNEFWISHLRPDTLWSPPIYTGLPVDIANYRLHIDYDTLSVKILVRQERDDLVFYRREGVPADSSEWLVSLEEMTRDSDLDGLTDLAEEMLLTDPENNDTDFDGKADGFDKNPLASPVKKLKIHDRLHKHVIERELAAIKSDQLMLVEKIHNLPMEYERDEGLVLSLSSPELDDYVAKFGYGVPILTATVRDTLQKYKVSFQYFVAPDDAWGYSVLYKWDKKEKKWHEGKLLDSWVAEESDVPPLKQIQVLEEKLEQAL